MYIFDISIKFLSIAFIFINTILSNRLTFVFKSEDSSSVYYTVSADLIKPAAPEVTKQLKEKEDKKSNLETEIRKNTTNLYELAKSLTDKTNDCNIDLDSTAGTSKQI